MNQILLIVVLAGSISCFSGCRSKPEPKPFDQQAFWQDQQKSLQSGVQRFRSERDFERSQQDAYRQWKQEFRTRPPDPIDLTDGKPNQR